MQISSVKISCYVIFFSSSRGSSPCDELLRSQTISPMSDTSSRRSNIVVRQLYFIDVFIYSYSYHLFILPSRQLTVENLVYIKNKYTF